ncbi:hypothetical protein [Gracilibacillus alcaliphilus]|uniref:hypothetical protein n=1 Tax=Gracilibacillus alcaliphilus TaxID=1401441 RepID=UPI001959A7C8|nr:hypothetical protein [Gracilibacillus alcaliphilus]MBM7678165.1 hypothetical protein [Gracilibacillus alcaliphilus]
MAKRNGYTFEVLFFYSPANRYTMLHLLNIAESRKLSKSLGALTFTLKRTKNEQHAIKQLVTLAQSKQVKEIMMSGAQQKDMLALPFWKRIFCFDKYNYILKNVPNIVLVLINHRLYNPFENGMYKNGREAYLVKQGNGKVPYILSHKSTRKKDISGLFFQLENTDKYNGIFVFIRNGKVKYIHVYHGRTTIR